MKYRKPLFYATFLFFLIAVVLLVTGSSVLMRPVLPGSNIPAGTPITWMGIIALPLSILFGFKKLRQPMGRMEKYFSRAFKTLLVLSFLWVPVCYLLAGNLSFTFGNKAGIQGGQTAMKMFWFFTYGIVGLPIVLLAFYGILKIFRITGQIKK